MMCTKDPRKRTNGGCSSHSWGQSLFKLLMDLLIQYGVSLRTHLHFLGSMQNEPQVIKFSLSPWGSCKWPALAIIQFGHLVSHQADGLCHQAVFRNLDAPSFWLCNQCKIYFWPLKSKFSQTSTLFPRYHTLRLLMVLVQITGTQKCAVRLLIRHDRPSGPVLTILYGFTRVAAKVWVVWVCLVDSSDVCM